MLSGGVRSGRVPASHSNVESLAWSQASNTFSLPQRLSWGKMFAKPEPCGSIHKCEKLSELGQGHVSSSVKYVICPRGCCES